MSYKERQKISSLDIICYIIFGLFTLACAFPFYYLLICSISDNAAVEIGKVLFAPMGIQFHNYVDVFKMNNLLNATFISVARTLIGTGLHVLITSYAAYFFTKREMWGKTFWYRLCVGTMYFSAGMIPIYLNIKMLGLTNTFWVYVLPTCLTAYDMILVKTSIEAMPAALEESAKIDGAGYGTIYWKIVLPLQKPILATIGLFEAVTQWNDFFSTKLYITNPKLFPLQFLLYEMLNQAQTAATQMDSMESEFYISPTGLRMTLTAIVVIPILCVYPFVQRYFVKGIMVGAIKG